MGSVVVVTGMAWEARMAAGVGVEVLHGACGAALEDVLAARLRQPCDGVVSFGVAGGLDPALAPGTVVVAQRIASREASFATDARWYAALCHALPRAVGATVVGVDAAVVSVSDKRELRLEADAMAADMESHVVARVAQAAALPFIACRVILDPACRALPSAALAALGGDGRIRSAALLATLARQPRQLAALLYLARDATLARAALRTTRRCVGERFALPER